MSFTLQWLLFNYIIRLPSGSCYLICQWTSTHYCITNLFFLIFRLLNFSLIQLLLCTTVQRFTLKTLTWGRDLQLIRVPADSKGQKRLRLKFNYLFVSSPTFFWCSCISYLITIQGCLLLFPQYDPPGDISYLLNSIYTFANMPDDSWNSANYFWKGKNSLKHGLMLWKRIIIVYNNGDIIYIYIQRSDHSIVF